MQLTLRDEWYTPDDLFERLSKKYGPFDLDAAASPLNTKAEAYYTKEDDALTKDWFGVVWCNPPYSRLIDWLSKGYREVLAGRAKRVVFLLPAHTATRWFHDYALRYGQVEFIKGKVKFGGTSNTPFWGSVVVIFCAEEVRRCQ